MNRSLLFNTVKLVKPRSNVFDLSCEKKLSFNMAELVPVYLQEIVPGDKFKVRSEFMLRFAPLVAPMMHRVNAYIHFFFVPNRLVWTNWQDFITGGEAGTEAPTFPAMPLYDGSKTEFSEGTLADYLGIQPYVSGTHVTHYISALPFRGYQLIYNEYYRDQTLQTEISIGKGDSVADYANLLPLRTRCWEKDYFTSSLPWTQRGGSVVLPQTVNYQAQSQVKHQDGTPASDGALSSSSGALMDVTPGASRIENLTGIDISINDLRRSTKLQQWLERNALGGSRYIEQIFAHFGVYSSDSRLQRPQYLGGGKTPIVISEVLNTSDTASAPQGNMAGHGIGVGNTNEFRAKFEEHGFVFGIMSVLPRSSYQNGNERHWFKYDKFDYFFPEFANIGEQAVNMREVYAPMTATVDDWGKTFGYQSRYAEYKYNRDSVHGAFRNSLNYWHQGRIFSSEPALNSAFVTADPTHRIFANTTTTVDKLYCQIYHNIKAIRLMPVYGTPI